MSQEAARSRRLWSRLPAPVRGAVALSAWPLADQLMVSACNFLTNVVVARVLGVHDFGVFTLAWSIVVLGQLLQFCLATTPMYSLAPALEPDRRRGYLGGLMVWQSGWTLLAALLLAGGSLAGFQLWPRWPGHGFAIALAAAGGSYLWQDWSKRGLFTLGRARTAFMSDSISYALQLAILFLAIDSGLTLVQVLWVMAATSGAAALLAGFGLRPLEVNLAELRPLALRHWQFGRWTLGTAPLFWLVSNLVQLASGALLGADAVAEIRAATLLFAASNVFFFSLENFVPSRAAILLQQQGKEAFFRFLYLWIGIGMVVSLALTLVIVAAPRFWLTLAFGSGLASGADLIYPLALQFPLACYIILAGLLLRSAGLSALVFRVSVVMAAMAAITIYPAIRTFGLQGALGSFVVSYAVGAGLIAIYCRRAPLLMSLEAASPLSVQAQISETVPPQASEAPIDPLVLAEYARQSAHLARGGMARRGNINDSGTLPRAVWCLRTDAGIRSLLCAIFPGEDDNALASLFEELRPDGAIVRIIGGEPRRLGLSIRHGSLFLSLGDAEAKEYLDLPGTFDAFLSTLGKRTRTHIRSSLRDFTRRQLSHKVVFGKIDISYPETLDAAARNMPKSVTARQIAEYGHHANAQEMPFRSELRAQDGTLVSLIFGYMVNNHTLIVCQINPRLDLRVGQAGISLLHRALLIRDQISRESRGLIFVNGCVGMLRPYCRPVHAETRLSIALKPISWLRCLVYVAARPYLWAFMLASLRADDNRPRQ
jgi:O-antigen/teichoic acid export membrane protein